MNRNVSARKATAVLAGGNGDSSAKMLPAKYVHTLATLSLWLSLENISGMQERPDRGLCKYCKDGIRKQHTLSPNNKHTTYRM